MDNPTISFDIHDVEAGIVDTSLFEHMFCATQREFTKQDHFPVINAFETKLEADQFIRKSEDVDDNRAMMESVLATLSEKGVGLDELHTFTFQFIYPTLGKPGDDAKLLTNSAYYVLARVMGWAKTYDGLAIANVHMTQRVPSADGYSLTEPHMHISYALGDIDLHAHLTDELVREFT